MDLTALGAHIYAGTHTIGTERHFKVLAHFEDGYKAGIATAKLNWPEMPIFEKPWPATDYAGTDYVYCNPPCLAPWTQVFTIDGLRSIKQLVRERSTVRVFTIDEAGKLTTRPIVGWHENPYTGKFYDVRLQSWGKSSREGAVWTRATANHKFMTRRGWVRADELQDDDEVCTGRRAPNEQQRELLDGMMLGDACVKKQGQLVVQQIAHQYIDQKRRALVDFVSKDWVEPEGTPCFGYTRKPRAGFYLGSDGWAKRERQRWYSTGKKCVPTDVRLTPLSIATWYMDDGTLCGWNEYYDPDDPATIRRNSRHKGFGGTAELCTDGFSQDDVDRLISKLNQLGINSRRPKGTGARNVKYPRICITADGFKPFVEMIGPYVVPEMRYKLPDWAPEFDPNLWDLGSSIVDWDRIHIVQKAESTWSHVYCLDVDETHNFVTSGGVVHNCAIFSAAGIRTTRGAGAWRTDPRRGCWYDCFNLIDSIKPRALSIESVCQAYTTGREMIDEFTKLALVRGYSVTHVLLNAVHMGVPQRRRRFFFVVHRPYRLVTTPLNWAPPTTVGEALAEALVGEEPIAEVLDKHREALRICRPGEGLREAWEKLNPFAPNNHLGHVTGRPSFNEGRLDASKPMGAMIGNFYFHPTEDRRLTSSELKALCGVPDSFKLAGPSPHWASLLARGVMPAVASWLAESVKNTLHYPDGDWRDRAVTLIDLRTPGVDPVDLTSQYLDANGRVRFRVKADGSITSSPLTPTVKAIPAKPYQIPPVTWAEFPIDDTPEPAPARYEPPERLDNSNPNLPDCLSATRGHGGLRRGEMGVHGSQPSAGVEAEIVYLRPPPGEGYRIVELRGRPIALDAIINDLTKPKPGEGSGKFMQRLWQDTLLSPDEIVTLVHANWQGRKTKRSDMYYNYRKLVDAGEAVRPWSVERASRKEAVQHSGLPHSIDNARPPVNDVGGSRDPVEDRGGPGDAGGGESQTLSADVGPVATSRSSTGAFTTSPPRGGTVKRALLTGSTPMQVGSEKVHMKLVTPMLAWRAVLTDLGYEVDWRSVRPGEDLSRYDFIMGSLNKPNAIVSRHVYGVLWCLMTRADVVACVDDWQTLELQPGFRTCSRSIVRAFRINGTEIEQSIKERLFNYLGILARDDALWPWSTVVPMHDGGDASLLGIRGPIAPIDPTTYVDYYPPYDGRPKERKWIQASLLRRDGPSTTWPVERYGNPGKRGFHPGDDVGLVKEPRVTEDVLSQIYQGAWGVISPPNNHPGSGWWRPRYMLAADARCVLTAPIKEAAVFGEPYVFASDPAKVEALNDDELEGLASDQRECLEGRAWPRERVVEAFRKLIEERT